jgi:hypothetical protein
MVGTLLRSVQSSSREPRGQRRPRSKRDSDRVDDRNVTHHVWPGKTTRMSPRAPRPMGSGGHRGPAGPELPQPVEAGAPANPGGTGGGATGARAGASWMRMRRTGAGPPAEESVVATGWGEWRGSVTERDKRHAEQHGRRKAKSRGQTQTNTSHTSHTRHTHTKQRDGVKGPASRKQS